MISGNTEVKRPPSCSVMGNLRKISCDFSSIVTGAIWGEEQEPPSAASREALPRIPRKTQNANKAQERERGLAWQGQLGQRPEAFPFWSWE